MTARTFDPLSIVGKTGGWDADIQTNFENLRALIHDGAWPLFTDLGVGASPDANATQNDGGLLRWMNDTQTGPALFFSDGAQWVRLGRYSGVTIADSAATTVAQLKTEFNVLLAALRLAGAIS